MKIKLLFLSLLFPLVSFGATNSFDNVKVTNSIKLATGTQGVGKFLISDAVGFGTWTLNGGTLTNLNASSLSSGTIPTARYGSEVMLTNWTLSVTSPITGGGNGSANRTIGFDGTVAYNNSGATNLNAANLASGTIPTARYGGEIVQTSRTINVTGPITGGGNLSADRTISFDGTVVYNNSGATNLNASNLASGTIPTARYGLEVALTNRNNSFNSASTNTYTAQTIHLGGIRGVPTASNAATGNVGEYLEVAVAQGSGISLTTATPRTLMSLSLTAGDWDINGQLEINPGAATTFRELIGGFSTTTNSIATFPQTARVDMGFPAGYTLGGYASGLSVPTYRFTCSTTTNLYFNTYADFATSTMVAYGFMTARRSANAK